MKLASAYGAFAFLCVGATYALHQDNGRALNLVRASPGEHAGSAGKGSPENMSAPSPVQAQPDAQAPRAREFDTSPISSNVVDSPDAQTVDTTAEAIPQLPPFRDASPNNSAQDAPR